jgi:uncharacterized repeat protein (TIGR04052 family)
MKTPTLPLCAAVLLMSITGCTKPVSVTLPFELSYHGQPVSCEHFPSSTDDITLKDFRLYLHDVALQNSTGEWTALELDQNNWQNGVTTLLDFENAKANCKLGNQATNTLISGNLPADDYQAVRFKVGVPFDLNHQNPLIAKPPLNESSMHWHWQGGYKFVRAEFTINNQPRRMHVGSLQCKGEIGNITHCEKPNRPQFTLNDLEMSKTTITVSLDKLLESQQNDDGLKLTCMGGSGHPWCAGALDWIGLGETAQTAFNIAKAK